MADKAVASFSWSLDIECPKCNHCFDLADQDTDMVYSKPIFNNKWEGLNGEEVICPKCEHEFEIKSIEY